MKEYQRAIGPLELAARMDPNLVEAHRYLATSYRALRNLDMAAKHRNLAEQALKRRMVPKA
jgi:Tfp pilus assembly protein PilF